jgi:inositol-pentakisphosphate 2-kinase
LYSIRFTAQASYNPYTYQAVLFILGNDPIFLLRKIHYFLNKSFPAFKAQMRTLDHPDVQLEYLAEGAANVVYKISPPDTGPSTAADLHFNDDGYDSDTPLPTEIPPLQLDPHLDGKLIRLRKDLPAATPMEESHRHFETMIQPLFQEDNLIGSELFQISRDILRDCNASLRRMEKNGKRPTKRHGVYLVENEKYGCLIMDMGPTFGEDSTCIEFKPKWLVQSPSAPQGSRRCRTCALRAMKRENKADPPEVSKAGFCPLNLVSYDKTKIGIFLDHVIGPSDDRKASMLRGRLIDFLYKNALLEKLRGLQLELDPDGVFKADLLSPKFLAAMTLRDCTLFLKVCLHFGLHMHRDSNIAQVPTSGKGAIEARLGDLDLKTSSGKKAEYWRSLERQLIDEGWYTATERDKAAHENLCQLS